MDSRGFGILSKFASVGLMSTLIHAFVYALSVRYFNVDTQFSNLAGYSVAVFFSYYFQMKWTFTDRKNKASFKSFTKFTSSSLIALFLNASFVFMVDEILLIGPMYALVGIVFITPVVTFFLLSLWVFPDRDKTN